MSMPFKTPPDRKLVIISRPHDFIYDPNYIQPSPADFQKHVELGKRTGARINLRPTYPNMFSNVRAHPRIRPCLRPTKGLDYSSRNEMSSELGNGLIDDVTGADRAKYGIRYAPPPAYHMHKEPFNFNKLSSEEKKKISDIINAKKGKGVTTSQTGFVNRGIQTEYRESETQTDPFSPPYKLEIPGSSPKILTLINMTWGKGLPFSLEDILLIERALSKRTMEDSGERIEDAKVVVERFKLLEGLEVQQWVEREKELHDVMQLKVEITKKIFYDYQLKMANDQTLKLERLQTNLRAKHTQILKDARRQYFRNLRKLEKYYDINKPPPKGDIIKDYTQFDSPLYAPLVRDGISRDVLQPPPKSVGFNIHRDFEALHNLVSDPSFVQKELCFDMHRFKKGINNTCESSLEDKRLDQKLERIYHTFKDWNIPRKVHGNLLNGMGRNTGENIGDSIHGPHITLDGDSDEGGRRRHVITLQKIARGRTIQRMVRKEIEDNMNELLGMKVIFDMDPNCLRMEEGQLQKLQKVRQQLDAEAENLENREVDEIVGHLEGESLNHMLDFLDKEMIRLIDERRIHALIMMAERERKRKEAKEGGRRWKEEQKRRTFDEIFRQIVGVHQSTVDLYLEEILLESVDRFAEEEARNHVRQLAVTYNEVKGISDVLAETEVFEHEETSAEVVAGHVVPEIYRTRLREKFDILRNRYKNACYQIVEDVEEKAAEQNVLLWEKEEEAKRKKIEEEEEAERQRLEQLEAEREHEQMDKEKIADEQTEEAP